MLIDTSPNTAPTTPPIIQISYTEQLESMLHHLRIEHTTMNRTSAILIINDTVFAFNSMNFTHLYIIKYHDNVITLVFSFVAGCPLFTQLEFNKELKTIFPFSTTTQ